MSTVGDILSTIGDFSTVEEIMIHVGVISTVGDIIFCYPLIRNAFSIGDK